MPRSRKPKVKGTRRHGGLKTRKKGKPGKSNEMRGTPDLGLIPKPGTPGMKKGMPMWAKNKKRNTRTVQA